MKKRSVYKAEIGALALVTALVGGPTAFAQTWDAGGGVDTAFSQPLNWNNDVVPSGTDQATLGAIETDNYVATYSDGETNTLDNMVIAGNSVLDFSGGSINLNKSSSTRRMSVGLTTPGTVNQTGGDMLVGHILRIGASTTGDYNLSGGFLNVYRGGDTLMGSTSGASLSIGPGAGGNGSMNISGGILTTRVGVEIASNSTFKVSGAGATQIGIGSHNSLGGTWIQFEGAALAIEVSTNGVTPILIDQVDGDGGSALLGYRSILDVSFIDGAMETGSWPVLVAEGSLTDAGMVFADSMGSATNDWGFITSNNTLYVGYNLGWPAGSVTNVVAPPTDARTLYWTGAVDTDSSNPKNWVENTDGSYNTLATWGIYSSDSLNIGEYHAVDASTNYVCDYNGTADFVGQKNLSIGIARDGTFNHNSGDLTFTASSSSVQTIGGQNGGGKGTLNVNGGNITLNAVRMGLAGSQGNINVNGGTLTVSRGWNNASMWIGYGSTGSGTGTVTVTGGRMFTRGSVELGSLGDAGVFCVEGSAATEIGIGGNSSLDGAWHQYSGSILKARVDEGGITPVTVVVKDAALGGNDGHVYFDPGSIIDLGWMPGVTNFGSFDIMKWDGSLMTDAPTLASSVDTNLWSFDIIDTNDDGTNDTLRATAYGETDNGTSLGWLDEYGLTEADEFLDNDTDGLLTWEEYIAGTIPTDSNSVLVVNSLSNVGGDYVISWQSVEGKSYSIVTNLSLVFPEPGVAASGIIGLAGETSVTSSIPNAGTVFFEIGVE